MSGELRTRTFGAKWASLIIAVVAMLVGCDEPQEEAMSKARYIGDATVDCDGLIEWTTEWINEKIAVDQKMKFEDGVYTPDRSFYMGTLPAECAPGYDDNPSLSWCQYSIVWTYVGECEGDCTGCSIDGSECVPDGATNKENCQEICDASANPDGWTERTDVCELNGSCYLAGLPNMNNACLFCNPDDKSADADG